jgi:hypothetical protein
MDRLVERLMAEQDRVFDHEEASRLVDRPLPFNGPYGLLIQGDWHIGHKGTDVRRLMADLKLTREVPRLYGVFGGDAANNWIGKLGHLYGEQSTTRSDEHRLVEHALKLGRWAVLQRGNHDIWRGAGDPLLWFARQQGVPYGDHQVRVQFTQPDGSVVRMTTRHMHRGRSEMTPSYGVRKTAITGGYPDHIMLGFHIHTYDTGIVWHAHEQVVTKAYQIGAYKMVDSYAKSLGLRPQNLPSIMLLVRPHEKDPYRIVTHFEDLDLGVRVLAAEVKRFEGAA